MGASRCERAPASGERRAAVCRECVFLARRASGVRSVWKRGAVCHAVMMRPSVVLDRSSLRAIRVFPLRACAGVVDDEVGCGIVCASPAVAKKVGKLGVNPYNHISVEMLMCDVPDESSSKHHAAPDWTAVLAGHRRARRARAFGCRAHVSPRGHFGRRTICTSAVAPTLPRT